MDRWRSFAAASVLREVRRPGRPGKQRPAVGQPAWKSYVADVPLSPFSQMNRGASGFIVTARNAHGNESRAVALNLLLFPSTPAEQDDAGSCDRALGDHDG